MRQFPAVPNILEGRAAAVVVSDICKCVIRELEENYHIRAIVPLPVNGIKGSERYHADMSLCHLGGRYFAADENNEPVISALEEYGADITYSGNISARIPSLNVCILKDKIIARTDICDKNILEFCRKKGMKIINVTQRYVRCSAAVAGENALITTDDSIHKACLKNDIDVLKISCEGISLEGYDNGFIGGCCGFIEKNTLAFCGDITKHIDYDNIKSFLRNYSVYAAVLGGEKLTDIGGILPVMENV